MRLLVVLLLGCLSSVSGFANPTDGKSTSGRISNWNVVNNENKVSVITFVVKNTCATQSDLSLNWQKMTDHYALLEINLMREELYEKQGCTPKNQKFNFSVDKDGALAALGLDPSSSQILININ